MSTLFATVLVLVIGVALVGWSLAMFRRGDSQREASFADYLRLGALMGGILLVLVGLLRAADAGGLL